MGGATPWQPFQDYLVGGDTEAFKKAVRDIFLPVQRLKAGKLRQYFEQIDSLKSPDKYNSPFF